MKEILTRNQINKTAQDASDLVEQLTCMQITHLKEGSRITHWATKPKADGTNAILAKHMTGQELAAFAAGVQLAITQR